MCIVILSWFSAAYYLLLVVCEWSHERTIASCSVLVAWCQYLLNSFVVHAYIHLVKQKSLSKFSLSRPVRWTELLQDKQYASWYVSNVSTFTNTFAIVLASFLHDLNGTNLDWRCFQQSCLYLWLCAEKTKHEVSHKIPRKFPKIICSRRLP